MIGIMIFRIWMIVALLCLFSYPIYSADVVSEPDLANYPDFFISNDRLDVSFVVGEHAKSEDVLSVVEIASSLQQELKDKIESSENDIFEVDVEGNPRDELTELYMDVFNKKKDSAANTILDTSIDREDIKDKNLIVVGGPCVNWVAAHFHKYSQNCAEGFLSGRGYIELFRNGKGIVMVVAGYSAQDTRTAAQIVKNYMDYKANFLGPKMRVSSAWVSRIKVE